MVVHGGYITFVITVRPSYFAANSAGPPLIISNRNSNKVDIDDNCTMRDWDDRRWHRSHGCLGFSAHFLYQPESHKACVHGKTSSFSQGVRQEEARYLEHGAMGILLLRVRHRYNGVCLARVYIYAGIKSNACRYTYIFLILPVCQKKRV